MTPAQRKYDLDLALSLERMAQITASRSRKVSDTFKIAAERIAALSALVPVDPTPTQPASNTGSGKRA
jgi:hypothetical protein